MALRYDLEIDRAAQEITSSKAKVVCVQLPDGLKAQARMIKQELEEKTDALITFWLGSAWGACDLPLHIEKLGVDLLIHWGHTPWNR